MKKILVIDDDEMILLTLRRLLTKERYGVLIAKNADEALEQLRRVKFTCSLIISDLKMPGRSGVEAIKMIRNILSDSHLSSIPEIIITGYAQEDIYQDALKLKAAAYIDKPFDMKPLLETIHGIIEK